jgi:hypothetical protein
MSDLQTWAYSLQPGDKAAVRGRGPYCEPYEILTLSRATATLLIFNEGSVHERRARKSDLMLQKSYARIEPVTDVVRDALARYRVIRDLSGLREEELKRLSTKYLRDMHSALTLGKAEAKKEAA